VIRCRFMARVMAAIAAVMAVAVGGCVVGRKIPYRTQVPRLRTSGSGSVALAVQDERDYILSGAKRASYCGVLRNGVGVPNDLTTASKRPLAEDFADVVSRALTARGFGVIAVPTESDDEDAETLKALAEQHGDRSLLIQIGEWKSDTYTDTSINYRVTAQVRDAQGRVIGQSRVSGRTNIRGKLLSLDDQLKRWIPNVARRRLERLLNDPVIVEALAGSSGEAPSDDGADDEDDEPEPPSVTPRS
jgi:hypothetical protein